MRSNKTAIKTLTRNLKTYGHQGEALVETLAGGYEVSAAEARAAGIANPSAVVDRLRTEGFRIFSNPWSRRSDRKVARGTINRYRIS
jgi:chemotaxis receptor (MCP) glutamine deamidase CheD